MVNKIQVSIVVLQAKLTVLWHVNKAYVMFCLRFEGGSENSTLDQNKHENC